MREVIAIIGLMACALFFPAIFVFCGGILFGADMGPYALGFAIWGVYVIGYILGLVADDVLS